MSDEELAAAEETTIFAKPFQNKRYRITHFTKSKRTQDWLYGRRYIQPSSKVADVSVDSAGILPKKYAIRKD